MTEPTLEEQARRASGFLLVSIDGKPVELPRLKIRQARAWKRRLADTDLVLEVDGVALAENELDRPIDVLLELVTAYDVTHSLGDPDTLEDRATDEEVNEVFEAILRATFPFVDRVPLTGTLGRLVIAALSTRQRHTSGPSPTGDSTPTPSRTGSPTSSSTSSGEPDRSG